MTLESNIHPAQVLLFCSCAFYYYTQPMCHSSVRAIAQVFLKATDWHLHCFISPGMHSSYSSSFIYYSVMVDCGLFLGNSNIRKQHQNKVFPSWWFLSYHASLKVFMYFSFFLSSSYDFLFSCLHISVSLSNTATFLTWLRISGRDWIGVTSVPGTKDTPSPPKA